MIKKIIILVLCIYPFLYSKNICIIGCGYVGLTMAAIFSSNGHHLTCYDINKERIKELNNKIMPIYEPQLSEMLFNTLYPVLFTHTFNDITSADIFYICTPTPTDDTGNCDYSSIQQALDNLTASIQNIDTKIICIKSTIVPGTIKTLLHNPRYAEKSIRVIYNPEFMREGSAIQDVCYKNPVILGGENEEALQEMENMYKDILGNELKILKTNYETAEMIKYAWNSFSAIRISYVNELAYICSKIGADSKQVIQNMAYSEELLPTKTIKPGPGYGGSCLPKDTQAFKRFIETIGCSSSLIHQAIQSNNQHIDRIITYICNVMKEINGTTITLLGLSFKANTNDIRNAPSLKIIKVLLEKGFSIKVYDPKAMHEVKCLYPTIMYCNSPYIAVHDSDCVVILTDWDEIINVDVDKLAHNCRKKIMIDTRGIFDNQKLKQRGFRSVRMNN